MAKKSGLGLRNVFARPGVKVASSLLTLAVLVGTLAMATKQTSSPKLQNSLTTKAACTCSPEDENYCEGTWFHPSCNTGWTCAGTKNCPESSTPKPTSNPNWPACTDQGQNDKCKVGATQCQQNTAGVNNGYLCKCVDQSHYSSALKSMCFQSVWSCGSIDNAKCPGVGGPVDVLRKCVDSNGDVIKIVPNSGERCFQKFDKNGKALKLSAARFVCPNTCTADPLYGCGQNREDFYGVDSVCFSSNVCGSQQIDFDLAIGCTASVCDKTSCSSTPPTTPSTKAVCRIKTAWKDEPENTEGNYNLKRQIAPNSMVNVGDVIVYSVRFSNDKTSAITNATIKDTLPSNVTFLDGSPGCLYNATTSVVTCNVGNMAANTSSSREIRVMLKPGLKTFVNTSSLTYKGLTTNTYCKISLYSVTPPTPTPTPVGSASCSNKLAFMDDGRNSDGSYNLTRSIPNYGSVTPGQNVVYSVNYINDSAGAVNNASITDSLPDGVRFIDASSGCSYVASTHDVNCTLGTVPAKTSGHKEIRVNILDTSAVSLNLFNGAYIQYTGQTSTGTCQINLKIAKTPSPPPTPTATPTPTPTATPTPPPTATPTQPPQACSIGGKVYNDVDANMRWYSPPDNMDGVRTWRVYLFEGTAITANPLRTAVTADSVWNPPYFYWPNSFKFDNLVCGRTYTMVDEGRAGWVFSGDIGDGITRWVDVNGIEHGRVTFTLPINSSGFQGFHFGHRRAN